MSKKRYQGKNFNYKNGSNSTRTSRLVAIDSNVFIDLAGEWVGHRADVREVTDNFYDRLAFLRKMVERGKLKLVITPTTFRELTSHGLPHNEQKFMEKYCILMQPKDKVAFARQVNRLMSMYVKSGIMPVGKKHPYGDAMIMAEATIAGLNLLTNNYRDFILFEEDRGFYKKDEFGDLIPKQKFSDTMIPKHSSDMNEKKLSSYLRLKGRFRALEIGKINRKMNYSYVNSRGCVVTPMPFTTLDFIGKTNEEEGLWCSNQFLTNFNNNELFLSTYENEQ